MCQKRKIERQKKQSFFLLEILVAMALFALAVVPLMTMSWSLLRAEFEEKKLFQQELELKSYAITTFETLYNGLYSTKTLEEGISLPQFNGRLQLEEGIVTLTLALPTGQVREFHLKAKK